MPVLLPPPKGSIKSRPRRSDSTTPSSLENSGKISPRSMDDANESNLYSQFNEIHTRRSPLPVVIPDITLSQLLTLGIDDLALKLNVPCSKLSTMTIVELTKYLSDYIERSSQSSVSLATVDTRSTVLTSAPPIPVPNRTIIETHSIQPPAPPLKSVTESSAVFKVSFDDSSDATFIAKFDDNFGIDNEFIPNFDHFNQNVDSPAIDRYAVFREIIDQDMQSENKSSFETKLSDGSNGGSSDAESSLNEITPDNNIPHNVTSKIDTKITEAISQAKDRYAALRDIILVEDLFDKPNARPSIQLEMTDKQDTIENVESSLNEDTEKEEYDDAEHSSPDAIISINLEDQDVDPDDTDPLKTITTPTISQPILSTKDDLEIDEYMNRAISNLSLDSRDHLSPLSKSPLSLSRAQTASTSPLQLHHKKTSPIIGIEEESEQDEPNIDVAIIAATNALGQKTTLNDMSTSPIPLRMSIDSINSKSPTFLLGPVDDKSIGRLETTPTKALSENPTEPLVSAESVNGSSIYIECKLKQVQQLKLIISFVLLSIDSQKVEDDSWAVFENDKTSKPNELPDLKATRGKRQLLSTQAEHGSNQSSTYLFVYSEI